MTATESQRTLQPYIMFSKHKYNFTRGFPRATFAAIITYSPLVRHKRLHLQNQDHLAGVVPNKHPVRCCFHFVSPAGMMDLPLPEDFTHVGLDSWQAAVGGTQTAPLGHRWRSPFTCGNTGRLPSLASIISFLDVRSQKSEVFQQFKVLGL